MSAPTRPRTTTAATIEDCLWLIETSEVIDRIPERLGKSRAAIRQALRRYGYLEQARLFDSRRER